MESKMRETLFQRDFGNNNPFNPWHKERVYGIAGGEQNDKRLGSDPS